MGKKSAPKSPDPKETAAGSTSTNVGTAVANAYMGNVNQNTPDGSLSYSQTGTYKWNDPYTGKTYDIPTFTATQTLSPQQQATKTQTDAAELNLATLGNQQSARLGSLLSTPFSLTDAPTAATTPTLQTSTGNTGDITKTYGTDYSSNVKDVQDALMSRLQPQMDQDRAALEQRLANQGIQIGSKAYDTAINQLNQGVNDQRTQALLAASQEQSRLAGLDQNKASFENAAQQQAYQQALSNAGLNNSTLQQMYANQNQTRQNYLNEQYALRNQPINEISALLSGSQVSNPQFVNTSMPSIATTDVAGLINQNYQNQLGAWQQKNAATQNILGGLFGLGAAGIMAPSDERVKKDVKKVGRLMGHNLYEFEYTGKFADGQKHVGVIAQEAEKKRPDAVLEGSDGVKRVDYGRLFEMGKKAA